MDGLNLEDETVRFIREYAPPVGASERSRFVNELRSLLEHYGRAALLHGNLPDNEHPHGAFLRKT